MRTALLTSAVLAASAFAMPLAAQETADERVMALADEYYDFNLAQYGMTESEGGNTEWGDRLWSVAPEAQRERALRYADILDRLAGVEQAALSEEARTNALVLRTLLESDIGDARFSEWEMPFDSDSNFWSYLAGRTGFATVEDYENYIGRMRDLPRYFAEQTANAKAGLARGFSVPRVTLEGRDASIEAYVVDFPEMSPFWAPFD